MELIQKFLLGLAALANSIFGSLISLPQPLGPTPTPVSYQAAGLEASIVSRLNELTQETDGAIRFTISSRTGYLGFLAGVDRTIPVHGQSLVGSAEEIARQFLDEYGLLFGIKNQAEELRLVRVQGAGWGPKTVKFKYWDVFRSPSPEGLGMRHVRFQQTFQNVPVFGAEIIVHIRGTQEVSSVNGEFLPDIRLEVVPAVDGGGALEIAREIWQKQGVGEVSLGEPALYIFNPSLIAPAPDRNYLVWQVEAKNLNPPTAQRWFYFINAKTGQLVFQLPGIFETKNREIHDDLNPSPARREGEGPTGIEDVDKAYDFTGDAYNYYSSSYDRDSYDDDGGPIIAYVRDWQFCPNAAFTGQDIRFCSGMAEKDIVAHEFTHWVTAYEAALSSSYQSGALNESFSDVLAAAVDSDDWQMGEDSVAGTIRDLANPPAHGDPDRLFSPYYYCGSGDRGGVHINSGTPNKAGYLMAEGGSFNGCTISGIGREKEEQIEYRALTYHLVSSANFRSDYDALTEACAELLGLQSPECGEVIKALQAVEMDQQPLGQQQGAKCLGQERKTPVCAGGPTPTPGATPMPTPGGPTPTPGGGPTPTPGGEPTPTPTLTPTPTPGGPTPTPQAPAPTPCLPDCAGRECGDDGCGGSCGICSGNEVCNEGTGQCELVSTPTPTPGLPLGVCKPCYVCCQDGQYTPCLETPLSPEEQNCYTSTCTMCFECPDPPRHEARVSLAECLALAEEGFGCNCYCDYPCNPIGCSYSKRCQGGSRDGLACDSDLDCP